MKLRKGAESISTAEHKKEAVTKRLHIFAMEYTSERRLHHRDKRHSSITNGDASDGGITGVVHFLHVEGGKNQSQH